MAACGVSAGRQARSLPDACLRTLIVALALTTSLAGCAGESDDGAGGRLLDGTSAQDLPVELAGIEGRMVLTSATVVPVDAIEDDSAAGSCLRDRFGHLVAAGPAVVRVGVKSETVTFGAVSGQAIFGCSDSPGPREANRRWCGVAYGELNAGRLQDPRLDIICETTAGNQAGFAWVQPAEDVRFVAVEQPGYTEIYEAAGGLPIRIATVSGVDVETSSATFAVSEHDAEGRRLREYELEAFVAG